MNCSIVTPAPAGVNQKMTQYANRKLLALCLIVVLGLPGRYARAALPAIGAISSSDPGSGVGMYQKLELTFPVTTNAANLQLPYDASVPAYAANLRPDEDARQGITVDGLFLPPGQTDWAQATVWPGFLYRSYTRTPAGAHKAQVENLVWAGPDTWKVRFAPHVQGLWQCRVRAADAGGTSLSAPQTFVCVSSESKGFVQVSHTDSRYLVFDTGSLAPFIGINMFGNGLDDWQAQRARISNTGASALVRLWIAGRSGLEVIGGFANSSGGRAWNFGSGDAPQSALVTEDAHTGRFSVRVLPGGQVSTSEVPVSPGHAHTLTVWVKPIGVTGDAPQITLSCRNADTYNDGAEQAFPLASLVPDANGWSLLTLPVPGFNGASNLYAAISVKLGGASGGHLLVDDMGLADTVTGADDLEIGDFERHVHYNQRQSWLLDAIVDDCMQTHQYLRLDCLENDDSVFCNVGPDGANAPHAQANFFGGSLQVGADTPVRRWQRYYARYLMARWGWSTAVAEFEFNNEGPPDPQHYAAAQDFAHALHAFDGDGRRLCGTSFYQNSAGTSYPAAFYEGGHYPDIDYADAHFYTGPEASFGQFTPFAEGDAYRGAWQRIPDGGPNGMGRLRLEAGTQAGASIDLLPTRIRGRGTWTVSYQARTLNGTTINRGGHGVDVAIGSIKLGGAPWLPLPGLVMPAQPPASDSDWTEYQDTFTVPDNAIHPVKVTLGADGGFTHGRIEFSNFQVTAPDGLLWVQETFAEPLMDRDAASLAQYLGLAYAPLSGDPLIGKPLSVGETDVQNNSPDHLFTTLQGDRDGAFMRGFAWAHLNPSGATIFLWNGAGNMSLSHGWWNDVAVYQKFLAGVPLANGRFRNLEATVTNPNLIVIGQSDRQAGQAVVYVYNRTANWFNLAANPGAVVFVTGTVIIPGLPDGVYSLETWDTAQGVIVSRADISCVRGRLTLAITGLAGDTAFKISPRAAH